MSRTRYAPAKPERYMQGAERELDVIAQYGAHPEDFPSDDFAVAAAIATVKAQLAIAAQLHEIDLSIMSLIQLLGTHPVLAQSIGGRELVNKQQERIVELEAQLAAAQLPAGDADAKPN